MSQAVTINGLGHYVTVTWHQTEAGLCRNARLISCDPRGFNLDLCRIPGNGPSAVIAAMRAEFPNLIVAA